MYFAGLLLVLLLPPKDGESVLSVLVLPLGPARALSSMQPSVLAWSVVEKNSLVAFLLLIARSVFILSLSGKSMSLSSSSRGNWRRTFLGIWQVALLYLHCSETSCTFLRLRSFLILLVHRHVFLPSSSWGQCPYFPRIAKFNLTFYCPAKSKVGQKWC
jgi:hypothetical protein